MKRILSTITVGLAVSAGALVPLALSAPAHADVAAKGGDYIPVAPRQMLLDTRSAIGAPKAQVGADKTLTVNVLGAAGVPTTGVRAVELDVTALNPATSTYIMVFASDAAQPGSSNFNAPAGGGSVSSSVLVPVGADGKIKFYNHAGSIDLAAAVEGYLTSGTAATGTGGYVPVTPARVISTTTGVGVAKAQIGAGKTVTATITGAGIPAGTTVVYGTMQVDGTATGGITTGTSGGAAETHGVMAYHNGQTTSGVALTLSSAGKLTIANTGSAAINLYFDVQAYIANDAHSGAGYRSSVTTSIASAVSVASGGNLDLQVGGRGGIPTTGAAAALVEFSAKSTATGYLRAYPVENSSPGGVSMLAFDTSYRSDESVIALGASGIIRIHNYGSAAMTFYLQIKGWFDLGQNHVVNIVQHAAPALLQSISGGSIDAAYVSSGGALFHGTAAADGIGSVQWAPVPSNLEAFTGQPAIAYLGNQTIQVSVLHANNGEVWTFNEPVGAANWTPSYVHTGGVMAAPPASANLPDGTVMTFGIDGAGALWGMSSVKGYWTLLSAGAGLQGTPTVVTISTGVQVVADTTAGTVATASYVSGALSSWTDLGGVGVTDKTAAVVNNGPRVRVIARQSDGTIISKLQSLDGSFPSAWTQAGSSPVASVLIGAPTAGIDSGPGLTPGTGKAFILARAQDDTLWRIDETGEATGAWAEWHQVATSAATDAVATPFSGDANNHHWLALFLNPDNTPQVVTSDTSAG